MAARDAECPSSEAVGRYVEGSVSGGELERLESHLAACPGCRLAAGAARRPRAAAARRTATVWWALAAAAAIAVCASVAFHLTGRGEGARPASASERARVLEAAFLAAPAGGVTVVPAESSATGSTELVVDPFPAPRESAPREPAPAGETLRRTGGGTVAG